MFQHVSADPQWYSDPNNYHSIPFPFMYHERPIERFSLHDDTFEYMGREAFQRVDKQVSSLKLGDGYTRLYIEGTMGYGKSHILAALACMLYRQGKRVVFIPDCRAMLRDPLPYIKSALLCAFADPLLVEKRNQIRACTTKEQIYSFFHRLDGPTPYFIVDQINAFELSDVNTDLISDQQKKTYNSFIVALATGSFYITGASANYQTSKYMEQKQTGDLKMSLTGGMSKVSPLIYLFSSF